MSTLINGQEAFVKDVMETVTDPDTGETYQVKSGMVDAKVYSQVALIDPDSINTPTRGWA